MALKVLRGRNIDNVMIGLVKDAADGYYSAEADRHMFVGVKNLEVALEMDTDENKVEGVIDDLYSRIMKSTGSLTGGKLPLEAAAAIFNGTFDEDASSAWWHVEDGAYVPYLFLDAQSLYDPDGGTADNRAVVYKLKPENFNFTKGQDGYAEVSFDFSGIFTVNPVNRSVATSKRCASFGRQATAAATLGNLIETAAVV